jgi:hypothetical protein
VVSGQCRALSVDAHRMQELRAPQNWPRAAEDKENIVRFEVITAVTMTNAVFCAIKTQFVPHMKHITSPLQSPSG